MSFGGGDTNEGWRVFFSYTILRGGIEGIYLKKESNSLKGDLILLHTEVENSEKGLKNRLE